MQRPDIEAPRLKVTVYDAERLSPGYWFMPSYDFLDQSMHNGGRWTAPHIFDETGELIWSGSVRSASNAVRQQRADVPSTLKYLSRQYDVFDFRISNVLGQDMLTFLYPRNRSAIILDTNFTVQATVPIADGHRTVDMHEFHFVDNGTRALFFYDEPRNTSKEAARAIGYDRGECLINDNLFQELDVTKNLEPTFTWSAAEHIGLYESSDVGSPLQERCKQRWDFLHTNSLDKFPDGSYLMSSRHTDTIYRILPDGTVDWRLGGVVSDFRANFEFSHQHHARVITSNETHTVISFFDNATKTPLKEATSHSSRGMVVELHTEGRPMTAKLLQQFPHPDGPGNYCVARANIQILPNGNAWICWVDGLLSTEHAPDGTLLMKTRVKQDWLKSYRTYKFAFVGQPVAPPDVHSQVIWSDADNSTTTLVHVSWNGATEVETWCLYKTDEYGNSYPEEPVAAIRKAGFETAISVRGFATYIAVEGYNKDGVPLGRSRVVKTMESAELSATTVAEESLWLDDMRRRRGGGRSHSWLGGRTSFKPALTFWIGFVCGLTILVTSRALWRAKRKGTLLTCWNEPLYRLIDQHDDSEKA